MWCAIIYACGVYVWCVHVVFVYVVCVFVYVCAHACAISFNAFANQIFLSTLFPQIKEKAYAQ